MEETEMISFVMWSVVTGIVMLVSGFSYDMYLKRKKHQISRF